MSMDFLERLYWVCSDENKHLESGLNLGELYKRIDDTATSDNLVSDQLKKLGLNQDSVETIENCFNVACWSYEQQGFINGFRLGMMLARELDL